MTEPVDPKTALRTSEEVGRAVIALIGEEPFFGHLLSGINRDITSETATAMITFRKGRPLLRVNPEYYLKTLGPDGQRSSIIKHEVLRLLLNHAGRRTADMDAELFTIASDIVISQLTGHKWPAPPEIASIDSFEFDLPTNQTVEWYYDKLTEHRDEIPEGVGPGESAEDRWGNGGEDGDEIEQAIADHELAKVASDARDRAGDFFSAIDGEVQAIVETMVSELQPKVDWRRVIRMFTASSRKTRIANTLRRPSKRYGTYPGIKVKRFHSLAVIIDTSGSVKEAALSEFFTEVRAIWRQGSSVTVIEADNIVRSTWEYRGHAPAKTKGRGGTRFDPALQWVTNATPAFDAALYFTDGKAAAPRVRPPCDVLWVLTPDADDRALRGQRTIKIPASTHTGRG